jgi:hypothetical protein
MIRHLAALLLVMIVAALFCSCGRREGAASTAELRRALEDAPGIEICLAGGGGPESLLRQRIIAAARVLEERSGKTVTVLQAGEPGRSSWPRIVLGSLDDPLVRRLLEGVGGELTDSGLHLGGQTMARGDEILLACAEDPERPGLPLNLFVASGPRLLLGVIEDLTPAARAGVRLFGKSRSVVQYSTTGEGRGAAASLVRPWPDQEVAHRHPAFILKRTRAVDPARALEYGKRIEAVFGAVAGWSGEVGAGYQSILSVSSTAEQRELTGGVGLAATGGRPSSLVVLLAPGVPDDGGAAVARAAARFSSGEPVASWMLDGAGIDAAGSWWGVPLEAWGAHLVSGGHFPELNEIVDGGSIDRLSMHQLAPARGLLFRFLRESRGPAALRSLWSGESEFQLTGDLEEPFAAWLRSREVAYPGREHESRIEALNAAEFLRGLAIDSDAGLGGGFDRRHLPAGTADLSQLGINSISVTSFFVEERPVPLSCGGALPPGRESLEGDAAIAQALAESRSSGARWTLLEPHLLLGGSAGYSARLRRTDHDHWREFFDALHPMVVHYSLLAELIGVDILCLGVELRENGGGSELNPEVLSYQDDEWGAAIAAARRAFGGALTYAAGSPGEMESFPHWLILDYVGISFYPRLSALGRPPFGDLSLRRCFSDHLARLAEVTATIDRPVLFVEAGLRSTRFASTETELGPGAADEGEQERALRQLRMAFEEQAERGFDPAGIFFWKWEGGGERGYELVGKPALGEISGFGAGR